jgi:LmbE family N-acetylglucosaminyl deacetylase
MQLNTLDDIHRDYRHVYLQPHFDDAILASGGAIALQVATGQRALVVTIFGGGPAQGTRLSTYATQILQRDGLGVDAAEAVRKRRAEDQAAVEALGADVLWLDLPEALYRGSPAFYQSDEALFGGVHPSDLALDEQIADTLTRIHEQAPLAALYAPLGVGHHVDHQLVCSAADRLAQRKVNVKFYEDFPYVTRSGALAARQKELGIAMEPEMVEISNSPFRKKEEAILKYRSQVPILFGSEDRMHRMAYDYSASIRRTYPGIQIERFWTW